MIDEQNASPVTIRLGFIASQEGLSAKVGTGIRTSLSFILDRNESRLCAHGLAIELVNENDWASPAEALRAAQRCERAGCVALIGPNDSASMKEVLLDNRFRTIPKIASFATATDLASEDGHAFFRLTTNDRVRAQKLIKKMREMVPDAHQVGVYSFAGPRFSYAQGLRRDVLEQLRIEGIDYVDNNVSDYRSVPLPANDRTPVLICGPSADAIRLIRELRSRYHRGGIFGFGSNTNFLNEHCLGTVVVSDQDRHDSDPDIRATLEGFRRTYPQETEPSIATMNAAEALVDAFLKRPASDWAAPAQARRNLIWTFQRESIQGLFGRMQFSADGEMSGNEKICLLQVARGTSGFRFDDVRAGGTVVETPHRYWTHARKIIALIGGAIGFVSAVLGILAYLHGQG